MIKLEASSSLGAFRINNKAYQKGAYEIIEYGDKIGIKSIHDKNFVVAPTLYSEWTDDTNTPFASVAALLTELESLFFLDNLAPSTPSYIGYKYLATNFTNLNTVVAPNPSDPPGTLAYVLNSQGTQWLPGSLGGTYYANGAYVWTGTAWTSDRNAIALAFYTVENRLSLIEQNKVETFETIDNNFYPTVQAVEERVIGTRFNAAYSLFTDFINSASADLGLQMANFPSGGAVTLVAFEHAIDADTLTLKPRVGITQMRSGAAINNRSSLISGLVTTHALTSLFKRISIRLSFRSLTGQTPSTIANWAFQLGFSSELASNTYRVLTTRFAHIRLPLLGEIPFNYKLECCAGGGALTTEDTGIPYTENAYEDFELAYFFDGVDRRIDAIYYGVVYASIQGTDPNFPANLPSATMGIGMKVMNLGGTGPTNRLINVDSALIRTERL